MATVSHFYQHQSKHVDFGDFKTAVLWLGKCVFLAAEHVSFGDVNDVVFGDV